MNNDIPNSSEQVSTPQDKNTAPSIWVLLGSLGAAICAGFAGYEAFHLRLGLWWGLGAGAFMLIVFLAQNASPSNALSETEAPRSVSIEKSAALIFILLLASVSMLWVGPFYGSAVLLMAIVFHTYGGFRIAEQLAGATRRRVVHLVIVWSIVILFSVFSQFVYPEFVDLLSSFGMELPALTRFVLASYSLLLLLPIAIAFIWAFWPDETARLRVSIRFAWISIVTMVLAVATMYLPIIEMGSVVG